MMMRKSFRSVVVYMMAMTCSILGSCKRASDDYTIGGKTLAVANAAPKKFIPTFHVEYEPTISDNALALGKFDLLDLNRNMYDDLASAQYPTTWAAIHAVNPQAQIYLYQMGPEVSNFHDQMDAVNLNNLGRYDVSRDHSMGSLNGDNPDLFLLDATGQRLTIFSDPVLNLYFYLMDFGSDKYSSYWLEAANSDIVATKWAADGIFVDSATASHGGYVSPVQYPTNASWSPAMNTFVENITAGLHGVAQKAWFNRGQTNTVDGFNAWLALDSSATPPDVAMEEAAFASSWAPTADTFFYSEADWRRQVDILNTIKNYKMTFLSHTKLDRDQSGIDNWGQPVTFWQSLWYSLSSFLLGRNVQLDNAYFMFTRLASFATEPYTKIWWYDEYDKIDLGEPLGPYTVATATTQNEVGGAQTVNVYTREYQRGYIYVTAASPQYNAANGSYHTEVASIVLPQATKQLTHETLRSALSDLPTVSTLQMGSHQGAILLKVADLSAILTATPNPVLVNDKITYTAQVANTGPSTASNATVVTNLGAGESLVSATPSQGSCTGTGPVTCNLGSLASAGVATVTIVAKATVASTVTTTGTVSATEYDPNTANNSASPTTPVFRKNSINRLP